MHRDQLTEQLRRFALTARDEAAQSENRARALEALAKELNSSLPTPPLKKGFTRSTNVYFNTGWRTDTMIF